jgi:hypothetical protein
VTQLCRHRGSRLLPRRLEPSLRRHHLPPALRLLCKPTLQLSPLRVVRRHQMAPQRDNVPLERVGLTALALRKLAPGSFRLGGSPWVIVVVVIHFVIHTM